MGLLWRAAPWMVAVALLSASLFAAVVGSSRDERALAASRADVARSAAGALEDSLDETVERTQSVAALYQASRSVSKLEFARFAAPLLNNSGVSGVTWIEHLTDAQRAGFERRLGSPVVRLGAGDRLERQRRRPTYDAILRLAARQRSRSTLGLDVGDIPARAGTLRAARATRTARSTPIVKLASSLLPAIIVYVPVFDPGNGELRGFVSGSYRVDRLDADIRAVLPAGTGVRLSQGGTITMRSGDLDGALRRSVSVAGRRWNLAVSSPPGGGLGYGPASLLIGLPLSAFLGLTVLLMARRTRRTQVIAEDRLTTAFEEAPIGMAMLDLDGGFVRVNRALAGITGYEASHLVGTEFSELVPPDHHADMAAALRPATNPALESRAVELPVIDVAGETRWVAFHIAPLSGSHGRPELMLAQVLDISDGRRAEQALARSARYFELSRDLVCTVGFDGYFKQLNGEWTQTLGWSQEELRSRPFLDFVHPDDREQTESESAKQTESNSARFGRGGGVITLTNRYRTKDGNWRWIDWRSGVAPDEDLIYASARDVTDRVQAEMALATSERQTREILETAHDAFISFDAEERITDWNPQAYAMFGWTREEAMGRFLADTILPEDGRAAPRLRLQRFVGSGEQEPATSELLELTALHRDGREFPVELTISRSLGKDGYSFNGFLRDVSERNRTQEVLAAAHSRAIEASRLKSEFVANMSHEIRTPLNGVIGMSGLLLDTELSGVQRDYADAIRVSGDALLGVINDVLDFSKIEAGKLEIESEPFEVRPIVEEVSSIAAAAAQAKGTELMTWADSELPPVVRGDGNRIRQVLANLVTNAVKFTAVGEVAVRVTGERSDGKLVLLRFEVNDTGIGIDPGAAERIFESFSQQDGSTTRRFGGTGLGLAISKQLVELMGGSIGVQSTPGEGSTFWFTVPAQMAEGLPEPLRLTGLEGVRVLVVDDNATGLDILGRQLASWGLACDTTADPTGVMRKLQEAADAGRPYRLLVVDSRMPVMSGIELTRAIRSTPSIAPVRILMLTCSGSARAAAIDAGVDDFVTKPIHEARLFEQVATGLGAQRAQTPSLEATAAVPVPSPVPVEGPLVLVAEDNLVNQRVAVALLSKRGFRVQVAANGHEAVQMHEPGKYEAVFMDCQMPELDGYQATAEIRRREGPGRHVPIIAMTASTMTGDRERCLAAGMDDYVGKPIRAQKLDEVIAGLPPARG